MLALISWSPALASWPATNWRRFRRCHQDDDGREVGDKCKVKGSGCIRTHWALPAAYWYGHRPYGCRFQIGPCRTWPEEITYAHFQHESFIWACATVYMWQAHFHSQRQETIIWHFQKILSFWADLPSRDRIWWLYDRKVTRDVYAFRQSFGLPDLGTDWPCFAGTGEMDKRYGFIYVDKNNQSKGTLERTQKKSFYWYKDVIVSNGEKNYRRILLWG